MCVSLGDAIVQEAVHSLREQCKRDVKSIQACSDCFEYWMDDHDDYFTRVCSVPHLLIYAKMRGKLTIEDNRA